MEAMCGMPIRDEGPGTGFSGADVAERHREIVEFAAPYDAAHVIAVIAASRGFATPDWRESEHGTPFADELVIAALLSRPTPEPTSGEVPTLDILDIAERLLTIGMHAATITMFRALDDTLADASPQSELAGHFRAHDAIVRGDAYESQELPLVKELFAPSAIDEALRRTIGFGADDAVAFEQGITQILERRCALNRFDDPTILQAPSLVKRLSITPSVLARVAGREEVTTRSFLDAFAVGFGHREPGGALVGGHNEIRQRPLARVAPDRYILTSGINLLAALRPTLERELKPSSVWETYQSHRAEVVEDHAERLLGLALRPDHVWRNVRYDIAGRGTGYEADRLILVDDALFLVEAKGGDLSERAKRGRPGALADELHAVVGRAAEQAMRVRNAVSENREVTFTAAGTGEVIDVPLSEVTRVEPIVVTLCPFGWLQGQRAALERAGILPAGAALPWLVGLHELELIADLTDHPSQLTRFIAQRRFIPPDLHNGADEVNLWMLYLQASLEGLPRRARVNMPNLTEEIDTYGMFDGVARPQMNLRDRTRRELRGLEQDRPRGWITAGERLIAAEQRTRRPVLVNARDLAAAAM
jgi:hypothetical protein